MWKALVLTLLGAVAPVAVAHAADELNVSKGEIGRASCRERV